MTRTSLSLLLATLVCAAQDHGTASLRFRAAEGGEFQFDTGVLRGTIRAKGRSAGLSPVVHIPSGKTICQTYGLFSHYRLLSTNHRYGTAAWDAPSEAKLGEDGSLVAHWPAAEGRPFEIQVTYRWSAAATLDIETQITAHAYLPDFESFLASYFSEPFTNAMVYVKANPASEGKPGLMAAEPPNGAWQMFPRDREVVKLIQDGRWTLPPNPVDWAIMPDLAAPLAIRRDPQSGLTAVLMAPAEDGFAVATPQQTDRHYSMYLALFGRTIKNGETARARSRLMILSAPSDAEILGSYQAYLGELRHPHRAQASNPFFALCMDTHDAKKRTLPEQAQMLRELGYDGVGHLWLDHLAERLQTADAAGLKLYQVYMNVNLDAGKEPYDPRLKDVLPLLKGRDVQLAVLIKGAKPSDQSFDPAALRILREIAVLTEPAGVRIVLYPHSTFWLERVEDSIRLAQKMRPVDVGVMFNLCHWLAVDDEKNLVPLLNKAKPYLAAISINGADRAEEIHAKTGKWIQPLDQRLVRHVRLFEGGERLWIHRPDRLAVLWPDRRRTRSPCALDGRLAQSQCETRLRNSIRNAWRATLPQCTTRCRTASRFVRSPLSSPRATPDTPARR